MRQFRIRVIERAGLGQTEVQHLDDAVGRDLDVGGLEIAVHDPAFVRGVERIGDLARDIHGLRDRDATGREALCERRSFDQLENERADASRLFETVNSADVLVVERREKLCFTSEPGDALGVAGELRRKDLDRDIPIQPGVARAIDLAHATLAEGADDLVRAELLAGREGHRRAPL